MRKLYQYKVYSPEAQFITTWTDVINEPTFTTTINGGNVQLVCNLARKTQNFGEGIDVKFSNEVQLWCYDDDSPKGVKIFSGYISRYDPTNDGTKETINVYILGFHTRLKDFMYEQQDGTTVITQNSKDPGKIAEDIINQTITLGLPLNWSETTLQKTGSVVSYTFSLNTCQEALDKVLELTDFGWYWYVDANKLLNLHPKQESAVHTFTIGKEIFYISPQKRIENIVNKIYFTGGSPTGNATDKLYTRYERQGSIQNLGQKAIKKVDERITIQSTMDIVANNLLDAQQEMEIRTVIRVKDNDYDSENGYNIESIKIGDTCQIRNYQDSFAASRWDIAYWDVGFWDFDARNITETVMQIVEMIYQPNYIELTISSKIPNVAKRVEDINRRLVDASVIDNPTNPDIGVTI